MLQGFCKSCTKFLSTLPPMNTVALVRIKTMKKASFSRHSLDVEDEDEDPFDSAYKLRLYDSPLTLFSVPSVVSLVPRLSLTLAG